MTLHLVFVGGMASGVQQSGGLGIGGFVHDDEASMLYWGLVEEGSAGAGIAASPLCRLGTLCSHKLQQKI